MSSRHFSCLFCRFRGDTVANVFQQHRGFRCSAIACEFACCLCCLLALCSLMGVHIFNRFFFYNILNNKKISSPSIFSTKCVCVYIYIHVYNFHCVDDRLQSLDICLTKVKVKEVSDFFLIIYACHLKSCWNQIVN